MERVDPGFLEASVGRASARHVGLKSDLRRSQIILQMTVELSPPDLVTAIVFLIRAREKQLVDRDEALTKLQRLQAIGRYSNSILKDAKNRIEGGE